MAPVMLEGDTLGSRHRHYNKLFEEAIASNVKPADIDFDKCDIENFLNIDIASHNRDVQYILDVLRCEDMLYVTRAINRSTWLITDQQYAHIINPKHLHSRLFPQMTTKAINKLMLHIRLNIKDAKRAKAFYHYCNKTNPNVAIKWLPFCSMDFIERFVENRSKGIPLQMLKRLCKRSINIFTIYIRRYNDYKGDAVKTTDFLLKRYTDEYLDVIESIPSNQLPNFGTKSTSRMLRKQPDRILNNIKHFIDHIDIPTLAKSLKNEVITEFLLNNANYLRDHAFQLFRHCSGKVPKNSTSMLLKQLFHIKDEIFDGNNNNDLIALYYAIQHDFFPYSPHTSMYRWYEFAPFEIALSSLKKCVQSEILTSGDERNSIFTILLACAGSNMQHIHSVLQYYHDKHINEPFMFKINFVNNLIKQTDTHLFDTCTWNILNDLFHSMDIYIESNNKVELCIQAIIVYKVLHNEKVPEVIEKKFQFNTLSTYKNKLNTFDQAKVFDYLKNYLEIRLQKEVTCKKDFYVTTKLLEDLWDLLTDWGEEHQKYENVKKLYELIDISRNKSWNLELSSLYRKMKSWRLYLLEYSLVMCPSGNACLNALKYQPALLTKFKNEVDAICFNDNVKLNRFLSKLRIYWPHSLAKQWQEMYLNCLDQLEKHKALIKAIYILLPRKELLQVVQKYMPVESKINWNKSQDVEISLRKNIAKNMHLARPIIPADVVLGYAKGDYLQYTVVSFNAIFYDRYSNHISEHISKYPDAPISLQKHCIRLAFSKLQRNDLEPILLNLWKSTKSVTIRTIIFESTFTLLCAQNKTQKIIKLWKLFSVFIDDLTFNENKAVYTVLGKIYDVPNSIQGDFYKKSYITLKSLPAKANCNEILENVKRQARYHIETLDPDFVANVLLESVYEQMDRTDFEHVDLITAFIMCSQDEETQMLRYNTVLVPIMNHSFCLWRSDNPIQSNTIQYNFKETLKYLCRKFEFYVFERKMIFPTVMYQNILIALENVFLDEDYVMLTVWKLSVAFVETLHNIKNATNELTWEEMLTEAIPQFGEIAIGYVKDDIHRFFPSIYLLFGNAFKEFLNYFNFGNLVKLEFMKSLLAQNDVIETYLLVLQLLPKYTFSDQAQAKKMEICKVLSTISSLELRMHYSHKIKV